MKLSDIIKRLTEYRDSLDGYDPKIREIIVPDPEPDAYTVFDLGEWRE